jgi:hypothetical protein
MSPNGVFKFKLACSKTLLVDADGIIADDGDRRWTKQTIVTHDASAVWQMLGVRSAFDHPPGGPAVVVDALEV